MNQSHNPIDPVDPTDYSPSKDAVAKLTTERTWPDTELVWSRVGKHYDVPNLDVTGAVDLVALEGYLKAELQKFFVDTNWAVRMEVQVHIDGGGYRKLPFGKGTVRTK
jgi:hypothetical protein